MNGSTRRSVLEAATGLALLPALGGATAAAQQSGGTDHADLRPVETRVVCTQTGGLLVAENPNARSVSLRVDGPHSYHPRLSFQPRGTRSSVELLHPLADGTYELTTTRRGDTIGREEVTVGCARGGEPDLDPLRVTTRCEGGAGELLLRNPNDEAVYANVEGPSVRRLVEVPPSETDDGSTGTRTNTLVVVGDRDVAVDYRFTVDGSVGRVIDDTPYSAEHNNDDVSKNPDGTITVTGYTGNQHGDSYSFTGEIVSFEIVSGAATVSINDRQVSVGDLDGWTPGRESGTLVSGLDGGTYSVQTAVLEGNEIRVADEQSVAVDCR